MEHRKCLSLWMPVSISPVKHFKNSEKLNCKGKAFGSQCFMFCSRSPGLETAQELN